MVRTSFTARPQAEIDAATKLREEEKQRQRNRYRVVCKNTFEPGEGGDLVLAGTQGDLMGWSEDAPTTGCVVVKWDHYMYADTFSEDQGATGHGLMSDIHPDHLTHIP
jgi:hypothetical protein